MGQSRNYSMPWQARKWLLMLEDCPILGFRIRKNLDLPESALGFSFRSNSLGLRGPDDVGGEGVAFGTSFTLGYAVDNGLNWFDKCLAGGRWLNLGFPVSVHQWEWLLNHRYRGPAEWAVVLYHPNFWLNADTFVQMAESGKNVWAFYRWRTEWWYCLWLEVQKRRKIARDVSQGHLAYLPHDGERHLIDLRYCRFDFARHEALVADVLTVWSRMLARFKRVYFFRVPMKAELAAPLLGSPALQETVKNHHEGWRRLQRLQHPAVQFCDDAAFTLRDYHPLDVHWNERGNERMARWIDSVLPPPRP
jgi:hypothetical protein